MAGRQQERRGGNGGGRQEGRGGGGGGRASQPRPASSSGTRNPGGDEAGRQSQSRGESQSRGDRSPSRGQRDEGRGGGTRGRDEGRAANGRQDRGGRGREERSDDRRGSSRGGDRRERRDSQPPVPGVSYVEFTGVVCAPPGFYGDDGKVPQLSLRVAVVETFDGREFKSILPVTLWGDLAERYSGGDDEIREHDVVRGKGRLGYNRSRGRGDEPDRNFARISVDPGDLDAGEVSFELLFDSDAKDAVDQHAVHLEGTAEGKWWKDRYDDSGTRRIRGRLFTSVEIPGRDRPVETDHDIVIWNDAADQIWDDIGDGSRLKLRGRLVNIPRDESMQSFTPTVVVNGADAIEIID